MSSRLLSARSANVLLELPQVCVHPVTLIAPFVRINEMVLTSMMLPNQAEGVLPAGASVTALVVDDLRRMPITEDISMS